MLDGADARGRCPTWDRYVVTRGIERSFARGSPMVHQWSTTTSDGHVPRGIDRSSDVGSRAPLRGVHQWCTNGRPRRAMATSHVGCAVPRGIEHSFARGSPMVHQWSTTTSDNHVPRGIDTPSHVGSMRRPTWDSDSDARGRDRDGALRRSRDLHTRCVGRARCARAAESLSGVEAESVGPGAWRVRCAHQHDAAGPRRARTRRRCAQRDAGRSRRRSLRARRQGRVGPQAAVLDERRHLRGRTRRQLDDRARRRRRVPARGEWLVRDPTPPEVRRGDESWHSCGRGRRPAAVRSRSHRGR